MKVIIELPEISSERLKSAQIAKDPILFDYIDTALALHQRVLSNASIENESKTPKQSVKSIEKLCYCFHRIVQQLQKRRAGRTTIEIVDEYDVQDLLHALLLLEFSDIRKEEWNPSYGGGASRSDFLLKPQKTVIEVKKTRKNLCSKEIGEQLIIDIAKYKIHPSCSNLICFVYDPDNFIVNPCGIENDLSGVHDDLFVYVFITPKGL